MIIETGNDWRSSGFQPEAWDVSHSNGAGVSLTPVSPEPQGFTGAVHR